MNEKMLLKKLKYLVSYGVIFVSIFMLRLNFLQAATLVSVTYNKENVLDIDVGNVPRINNGVIYIANRNSRLVNAKELPSGGITVASPLNVYIKGNYNSDSTKWQPSAVITNSLVYILSDVFEDNQEMPALRLARNYPFELSWIYTDNNLGIPLAQLLSSGTAGQKVDLETEIKSFFGLSSFSLGSVTTETGLVTAIRNRYYSEYNNTIATGSNRTPNKAQNTTVRLAIASPYDISAVSAQNDAYMLEDWSGRLLPIEGAFIQLKGSWISDTNDFDGDGNTTEPLNDIPPVAWYKRTGGPNAAGSDPLQITIWTIQSFFYPINPAFEYEEQFATASKRPSGDFFGGSQSRWEELNATNYNFTHHND